MGIGRCFVFWIVFGVSLWELGGALCFGLYLRFRCGNWEVLCALVLWEVEILGGLRNGVKV